MASRTSIFPPLFFPSLFFSPDLGSPDFSPLLCSSHDCPCIFFSVLKSYPYPSLGGPKTPPVLGSPDFSPLSHRPIGTKFGIHFLLINAHGDFSHFSLAVIFLLIFLEMLANYRCCFRCAHRWRWRFPGRCAIASVHEIRVPFLD